MLLSTTPVKETREVPLRCDASSKKVSSTVQDQPSVTEEESSYVLTLLFLLFPSGAMPLLMTIADDTCFAVLLF